MSDAWPEGLLMKFQVVNNIFKPFQSIEPDVIIVASLLYGIKHVISPLCSTPDTRILPSDLDTGQSDIQTKAKAYSPTSLTLL
jgi:hypothetical protein